MLALCGHYEVDLGVQCITIFGHSMVLLYLYIHRVILEVRLLYSHAFANLKKYTLCFPNFISSQL